MPAHPIPKSFRVSGRQYKVLRTRLSSAKHGECTPALGTVYLHTKLSQREAARAFWHEAVHAVMYEMRLNWRDEALVTAIADGLVDVIKTARF